ncbi:HAD-like domain-containing protein [Durotheca rogersii]|uniref:HAD-like domain-containing protein n=1 Tax=Durotheca rogersii TaxID=419775 RepID=UPI002220A779|nr:HAD-like domain-containing protein [Durotheca rogersii]KAI5865615.1 HAD-like domain-containing protein [Durotheca rogersii]
MPIFEDYEAGKTTDKTHQVRKVASMTLIDGIDEPLLVPGDDGDGPIEVPASRSPISKVAKYMHTLSATLSMKERRRSRNSFGAALPIPRSKRNSRLSSVRYPDELLARPTPPGMPAAQTSRAILAAQVQSVEVEKVMKAKNMAFAFDIDGVLVHGDRLIPEGRRALEILNGDNELGIQIPHIFLTNGSGKPEKARCEQLSKILQNPVDTEQFIQSHTPMSALAEYYNTVLVVGGEGYKCREVAEAYGFKDVVVPNDIVAWDPTIAPYRVFTDAERASSRPRDFSQTRIEAIMVFSDSRDYATDMQIIVDVLRSEDGRLGTLARGTAAAAAVQRIPIYFSQGDLLCPTEHWTPRMSQGAFRIGLEAMYRALTGADLERVVYGKPEAATYRYADGVLAAWMGRLHGEERLPAHVYMVGDNPASDIIGGNMYGWHTCLVRTGVFQGGANDDSNPANFGVFSNVLAAVEAALREQLGEDFKMRFDDRINLVLHGDEADAAAIM